MPEIKLANLGDDSETLLIPLYYRAMELQRPDAMIKDEMAVELIKRIFNAGLYDFGRINSLHLSEANKLVIILRNREFDFYAQNIPKCETSIFET